MLSESSDKAMIDVLRRNGAATISTLVAEMGVTATAVRQRLQRLMADGLIERQAENKGRGRPNHKYSLTDKGQRSGGNNFADLAEVLWDEIKSVADPEVRRGLLARISGRLASRYQEQIGGACLGDRMTSFVQVMADRKIAFQVDQSGALPVLSALACPYPELAVRDRGVCTMEKLMLSEMLGESVHLSACRLDGASCCTFTPSGS